MIHHNAHTSHHSHNSHPISPPSGDCQTPLSFQNAEAPYNITYRLAHKFLAKAGKIRGML